VQGVPLVTPGPAAPADGPLAAADLTALDGPAGEAGPDDAAAEAAAQEAVARGIARAVMRGEGAEQRLDAVVGFFGLLGTCVEAGACSRAVVRDFFGGALDNFVDSFGDEIAARQAGLATSAHGLCAILDAPAGSGLGCP
jgi:hypothetical protein